MASVPPPPAPPQPPPSPSPSPSPPAPPPAPPVSDVASARAPRAGELTPSWIGLVAVGWAAVAVALAAVWGTSRQLGLSTWWLGPPAQPQPVVVSLAPFVPPVAVVALTLTRNRYVPWAGLIASALLAGVALGDLGRVTRLGIVELVIAACGALVSVAAFAGRYRAAAATDAHPG